MSTSKRYSPEVPERAVRLLFEHEAEHSARSAALAVQLLEKLRRTVLRNL